MNSKSAGLLPVALLVVLAGLSYWLEQISRYSPDDARKAAKGVPDFVMDKFRAIQTGVDGKPVYTITADKLKHYSPADYSELFIARLYDLTPNRPPMSVEAETAQYNHRSEAVHFARKVVLVREPVPGSPRLTLITSAMTVLPKQGKAFGNQAMSLQDDAMHVTAVGFDVDKNARLIRLHSRVKAIYAVPASTSR